MSLDAQKEISRLLYEEWFRNYLIGLSVQQMVSKLDLNSNEISKSVEILESDGIIQGNRNRPGWYVVTIYGIDRYEQNLAPSEVNSKKQERRMVLETLLESYNRDIDQWMSREELMNLTQINDLHYLLAVVVYLQQKNLVSLDILIGGDFTIRLSALGFQSLQDFNIDNAVVMGSAYRILFGLENQLRQFIESRMRSKCGSDWWNKCVSDKTKKRVDEMRQSELGSGWQVSVAANNTEYLLFEHLEKILTRNWNDVFESVFQDQQKIIHRLRELENIRNSIAHTRMLTTDGMNRLEQYSQDLLNMMHAHRN